MLDGATDVDRDLDLRRDVPRLRLRWLRLRLRCLDRDWDEVPLLFRRSDDPVPVRLMEAELAEADVKKEEFGDTTAVSC